MNKYREKEIITAFLEDEGSVLDSLYRDTYPLIYRFIVNNGGDENDAKDILQESFLIVLTKIRETNFILSCEFSTYIYSICKNLWLKNLRIKKQKNQKIVDLSQIADVDFCLNFEKESHLNSQYFLFLKHFQSLSPICKEILRMFFEKKSFGEIAKVLNLINYDFARKKKYKCKKVLIDRIKRDPNLKTINNEL